MSSAGETHQVENYNNLLLCLKFSFILNMNKALWEKSVRNNLGVCMMSAREESLNKVNSGAARTAKLTEAPPSLDLLLVRSSKPAKQHLKFQIVNGLSTV